MTRGRRWVPSPFAFGALPGLSAPVSAPAAPEGLDSTISGGRGWARFVRFREVGRTQQETEMGAQPPISAVSQHCPLGHQHRT
jgi:hypothetical protein